MAQFILCASDLRDGDVVYWTGSSWTRARPNAVIADVASAFDEIAVAQIAVQAVVDAYAVEVDAGLQPVRFRERVRSEGPTVRADLARNFAPSEGV